MTRNSETRPAARRSLRDGMAGLGLAMGLMAGIAPAGASNLVTNGDFESGTLSGWTAGDGTAIDAVFPHGGGFDASFATLGSVPATLSQDIATTPGGLYRLTFHLLDELVSPFDSFTVTFGGFSATITGDAAFDPGGSGGYALLSFDLPADTITGGSTALIFSAINDGAAFNLDDVALADAGVDVPEPGTLSLLALPLLAGLRRARSRRPGRR